MIRQLLHAGMNVARFNFSHGNHEEHRARIERLRRVAAEENIPVALLLDTKGPEIRTGVLKDDTPIELTRGEMITVTTESVVGTRDRVGISYLELPSQLKGGEHLFIADGVIDLEVVEVAGTEICCRVESGGTLGSRKNVNIPGIRVQLPAITEKDRADIEFAIHEGMDFIAASFIRKPSDVVAIRTILRENESPIRVIAKIEDQEGLGNIDEIIRISDGIMVARGDLGVQLPCEEVPLAQKRIIQKCNTQFKPVITATQMLDSMIVNPRPTRAELTDVANAIFDGTDAVMLSGETATGRYPIKACQMLEDIARAVEQSPEYAEQTLESFAFGHERTDVGLALAKATFVVATEVDAAAIVVPTLRGNTPRILSRYRPSQSIIAVTTSAAIQRQLLMYWGIVPIVAEEVDNSQAMIANAIHQAIDLGLIGKSDRIVTTAGIPIRSAIPMNTITVHFLGTILNRGQDGFGRRVTGRVVKPSSIEEARNELHLDKSEILVAEILTDEHVEFLPGLAAVILEERSRLSHERIRAINPDLSLVSQVPDAMATLETGATVTVDGFDKIIYEGVL